MKFFIDFEMERKIEAKKILFRGNKKSWNKERIREGEDYMNV